MGTSGNIEITDSLKAYVETNDIILVDRSKLSIAQETRLYFEICLAIAMCFLGATFSNFQIWLLVIAILFISLSAFFVSRFIKLSRVGKLIELEGVFKYGQNSVAN